MIYKLVLQNEMDGVRHFMLVILFNMSN